MARTKPAAQVFVTHSHDVDATWAGPRGISATASKPTWGRYGTGLAGSG